MKVAEREEIIGEMADGARVALPVIEYQAGKGPAVFVGCSIHGDELTGQPSIWKLREEIERSECKGRLTIVPVMNPMGFNYNVRGVPMGSIDLNRLYPGDAEGSLSERTTAKIWALARQHDYVVDVHTAGWCIPGPGDTPTSPDPVFPDDSQPILSAMTPKLVLSVSPSLKPYIFTTSPSWADLVEAANELRQQLGISRSAWIDACQAMGRYQAATAVAVIAAKGESIRSPGGYLRGMISRSQKGELRLSNSLWGLARRERSPGNLRCMSTVLPVFPGTVRHRRASAL